MDEEKCVVGWIQISPEDQDEPGRAHLVEYQLVALTYTGGWYRLALPSSSTAASPASPIATSSSASARAGTPTLREPLSASPPSVRTISMARPRSGSGSSFGVRSDKGKERDREKEEKPGRDCVLREYRRFGRWDGWG